MKPSFCKNTQAFTFVELITVITILVVLSAIGFVSFSGYLVWVRDTSRLSQLSSLYDGLEISRTSYSVPMPDDALEIRDGNTLLWYQWVAGKSVLNSLGFTKWWVDPKDDSFYIYYLSNTKREFQLMGFLEEEENVPIVSLPQAYAKDYSSLFPVVFWRILWILLDESTQTPMHEIESGDLDLDGDNDTYTAYFENDDIVTDTGDDLADIITDRRTTTVNTSSSGSSGGGSSSSSSSSSSNRYPWCDMDNITVWSYTIAACNVWSSTAGTWTSS